MKVWCAHRKKKILVQVTCLNCKQAIFCTRFFMMTLVHKELFKNRKIKKKLNKIEEIRKFISDTSGRTRQAPVEGW